MEDTALDLIFARPAAWLIPVFILTCLPASAETYREIPVGASGTISGSVTFSGEIPPPQVFRIRDFPDYRFCNTVSNGNGDRVVPVARVGKDGALQDAVVYIEDIESGKPFKYGGTQINAENCEFLVQNEPSSRTGVVVDGGEFRVLNLDADPSRAQTAAGLDHTPQAYEILGGKKTTLFKLLVATKGKTSRRKIELKYKNSSILVECAVHNYMQVHFLPVRNPYFGIVGEDGRFAIDRIPPGRYKVRAWHPAFGTLEETAEVGPDQTVKLDFAYKN